MEAGSQYVFSMESDGYQFGKLIGALVVTTSVSRIIREVIENNIEPAETAIGRLHLKIGSYALAWYVSGKVWTDHEKAIDQVHDRYVKASKGWGDAKPAPTRVPSNAE